MYKMCFYKKKREQHQSKAVIFKCILQKYSNELLIVQEHKQKV